MTPDEFKAIAMEKASFVINNNLPADVYKDVDGLDVVVKRSLGWVRVETVSTYRNLCVDGHMTVGIVEANRRGEVAYKMYQYHAVGYLMGSLPGGVTIGETERMNLDIRG